MPIELDWLECSEGASQESVDCDMMIIGNRGMNRIESIDIRLDECNRHDVM